MDEYLYHVTYIHRLPSIQASGLQPGHRSAFAGTWYEGYSQGSIFLTEGDGVSYWMSKLEDHAHANTDNTEEGWVPVVLSIPSKGLDLVPDPEGTRDSLAGSWMTSEGIEPGGITIWNGDEWVTLDAVDADDMNQIAMDNSEFIEEDGTSWWEMDFETFLPPDEELEDV